MNVVLFETARVHARLLLPGDAPAGQALVERCADFFELVGGALPGPDTFSRLASEFPKGSNPADCFFIGYFLNDARRNDARRIVERRAQRGAVRGDLVGLAAWVRDFPAPRIWFLDLMIIAADCRRGGLGAEAYAANEAYARGQGATVVEIAVAEQNVPAERFWRRNGFVETERSGPVRYLERSNVLITMRKSLSPT